MHLDWQGGARLGADGASFISDGRQFMVTIGQRGCVERNLKYKGWCARGNIQVIARLQVGKVLSQGSRDGRICVKRNRRGEGNFYGGGLQPGRARPQVECRLPKRIYHEVFRGESIASLQGRFVINEIQYLLRERG